MLYITPFQIKAALPVQAAAALAAAIEAAVQNKTDLKEQMGKLD